MLDRKQFDISVLLRLLRVVKSWLIWLASCGFLMVLREGARMALFDLIGRMVDRAIGPAKPGIAALLASSVVLILVISLIRGYAEYASELMVLASFFSFSKKVVSRIVDLPMRFLEKHKTGDLISRLNNDIDKINNFLGYRGRSMYENLLKYLIAATYMCVVNWKMAAICVLMGPVVMVSIRQLTTELQRLRAASNTMQGKESAYVSDTIQGIREVKAFNLIPRRTGEYHSITNELLKLLKPLVFKEHIISGLCDILFFIPKIVIMGLGGLLVLRGEMSVGQVLAFRFMYTAIRSGIDKFVRSLPMYREAVVTGKRIFEITDEPTEEEYRTSLNIGARVNHDEQVEQVDYDGHVDYAEQADRGELLRLDRVSFSYGAMDDAVSGSEAQVGPGSMPFSLGEISFTVRSGETIALVGHSGCGKSTILQLIAGLYEPDSGTIYYGEHSYGSMRLDALRSNMAIVTQDPFLFPTTIHNNIAFGRGRGVRESNGVNKDLPMEPEIVEAARNAYIHNFVIQLPRGYESLVGERGVKLSGGQMQRVSIARAILKEPELLILDEPTSALDTEAEHRVQLALGRLMRGRSTIVAAHRLSSIRMADKILVLDKGEIVERGTHASLMNKRGLYYNLYNLQIKEEKSHDTE